MEFVRLSTDQLNALGMRDPILERYYVGAFACDELQTSSLRGRTQAHILNTHPGHKPGEHWIAVWTYDDSCELLDSYGLDLHSYQYLAPFIVWLNRWKYIRKNDRVLQSIKTASWGDYAMVYLMCKARGQSMNDFLSYFTVSDYVQNDHIVGNMLEDMIQGLIK